MWEAQLVSLEIVPATVQEMSQEIKKISGSPFKWKLTGTEVGEGRIQYAEDDKQGCSSWEFCWFSSKLSPFISIMKRGPLRVHKN